MIKQRKSFGWQYIPNKNFGTASFDGLPCPSIKAYECLGDEGIKQIDEKLKQLKKYKEELFGKCSELIGFDALQMFRKHKTGTAFCYRGEFLEDIEFAFPERISPDNYIITVTAEVRKVLFDSKIQFGHIEYTDEYLNELKVSQKILG